MRDLLIITPSRRRPASVKRLTEAVAETCTARTDLVFAFDDDDPDVPDSIAAAGAAAHVTGPRQSMCAWTNVVAAEHVGEYRALASLGDDHVPRTKGWDTMLLESLDRSGARASPTGTTNWPRTCRPPPWSPATS